MEKRIQLELSGRPPKEVAMLSLDNCRLPQIVGLSDEFVNLEALSMTHAGLTSLKGFPNLPHLKRLDLSENQLSGGLENLSGCPSVTHLNLSDNRIKDIEALKPLKHLKELKSLDLFVCDVENVKGFRDKMFDMMPHLKYLDGFNRDCNEAEEDETFSDPAEESETEKESEGEPQLEDRKSPVSKFEEQQQHIAPQPVGRGNAQMIPQGTAEQHEEHHGAVGGMKTVVFAAVLSTLAYLCYYHYFMDQTKSI